MINCTMHKLRGELATTQTRKVQCKQKHLNATNLCLTRSRGPKPDQTAKSDYFVTARGKK